MSLSVKYQKMIKMNQNNGNGNTNGGTSGQANGQAAPQGNAAPQASGNSSNQQQPPTGQQQTPPPNEGLGYEDAENVSLGDYGSDGLKQKAEKPHEKIKLGYELENTEGFSDDEVLEIKDFAAKNKLSKEAAKAFIDSKRSDAAKFQQMIEQNKQSYQAKIKAYKEAEFNKLKAEIGGEGGKEFKGNLKKVSDFLAQNLPQLKKEIDEKGVFLSASVMKDLYNLQAKLLKEDPLVNGGGAGSSNDANQPAWAKRYK